MEPIRRRDLKEPDRIAVQEKVIAAVQGAPEAFLAAYRALPASYGGRYVCSDAFKETFAEYRASRLHRDRYNTPVHNAAAVLAAEQFDHAVRDRTDPARDTAIFLTGIPGAGKTSSLILAGFPAHCRVLFEGQLNRPETSFGKIDRALQEGLQVDIVAVHLPPELALARTLQRFTEHGRGASLSAMAEIQGGLPDGLRRLRAGYGNDITLTVVDNTPGQQRKVEGWDSLWLLEKEGNRDRIAQRLEQALQQHRALGLTDDAWRHALGTSPGPLHVEVVGAGGRGFEGNVGKREPSTHGGKAADLSPIAPGVAVKADEPKLQSDARPSRAVAFEQLAPDEALRKHPELRGAYAELAQQKATLDRQYSVGKVSVFRRKPAAECKSDSMPVESRRCRRPLRVPERHRASLIVRPNEARCFACEFGAHRMRAWMVLPIFSSCPMPGQA